MKQTLIFCIISLCLLNCRPEKELAFAANYNSPKIIAAIDSIGTNFIRKGKVLGFSVAVLTKGDTLYNGAFGFMDSARTQPTTTKTIYKIASLTKPHVTTVVLKLAEEDKLSLSDYLYDWLPDYPNAEHAKKITLRNLITHTSGIPDYITEIDSLFLLTGVAPTKKSYYDFVANKPLLFEPNSGFAYSNTGFVLMGMIIEKATGKSLENEIERVIAGPMNSTSLRHFSEHLDNRLYSKSFELRDTVIGLSPMNAFTWIRGDGGWSNTAIELAHFPFGLSDGTLLSRASLAQMTRPQNLDNGIEVDYGLGLRMGKFNGEKVWGHTGGDASTWAMMQFFPQRELSIAVLVNTNSTPHSALEIWGHVALAVLNINSNGHKGIEVTSAEREKFKGDYQTLTNRSTRTISIFTSEDGSEFYTKVKNSSSNGNLLHYLGNQTFALDAYPMDRIVFHSNEAGEVLGYSFYANGSFRSMRLKLP